MIAKDYDIYKVNLDEVELDINTILFGDGRFNLKYLNKMQPVIDDLKAMVELHSSIALRRQLMYLKGDILQTVRESVDTALAEMFDDKKLIKETEAADKELPPQ